MCVFIVGLCNAQSTQQQLSELQQQVALLQNQVLSLQAQVQSLYLQSQQPDSCCIFEINGNQVILTGYDFVSDSGSYFQWVVNGRANVSWYGEDVFTNNNYSSLTLDDGGVTMSASRGVNFSWLNAHAEYGITIENTEGKFRIPYIRTFTGDADALSGGLSWGDLYQTPDGFLKRKQ